MSFFQKIKSKMTLFMGLIISQMLITKNVFAQASGGAFEPPAASDMSRQFINQIFGGLLDGGADAFGDSITTFNSAILIVGGILAAHTILSGTLNTAHDGEMLGKKFSSIWIPIRYALGTALVLPIISGYCLMQVAVMWIVMQGASLGNMAWVSYVSSNNSLIPKVSPTTKENLNRFVQDVYMANVCIESKNYATELSRQSSPILNFSSTYSAKLIPAAISTRVPDVWVFGNDSLITTEKRICGTISTPLKPSNNRQPPSAPTISSMNNLQEYFIAPDPTSIYETHKNQIQSTINDTKALAQKAVRGQDVNISEINAIADKYYEAIVTSANSLINTNNNSNALKQIAQNQGWFLAGSWVTQIIQAQNKVNAYVNFIPTTEIKSSILQSALADDDKLFAQKGYKVLEGIREDAKALANNNKLVDSTDNQGTSSSLGSFGYISKGLAELISGIDFTNIKTDTRHPLILMQQLGDRIFTSITAGVISVFLVSMGLATGVFTGFQGLTVGITFFGIFGIPIFAFIGIAGMLSYILPNLPFLLWVGIIIGWTIMVVEAIIAAPLWAIMHLHPNGDDLTGRGGNGYMLVLGLLLRPILIIFGLIAAIILSGLFGQLINRVFFDIFNNNNSDSTIGFFGIIFGVGVYTALMFTVLKQTFNLMYIIPDQLLRWIGGGQEQLGQYAGGLSAEGLAKGSAIAGAATGLVTEKAAGQLQQGVSSLGQLKAQQEGKEAQKAGNLADRIARYGQADRDYGSGMGNAMQKLDEKNGVDKGKGQLDSAKQHSAMRQAVASFGAGSNGADQYIEKMNQNLDSGMSFNDAHNDALISGTAAQFESGDQQEAQSFANNLSQTAQKIDGSGTSGKDNSSASQNSSNSKPGEPMMNMLEQMGKMQRSLQKEGMHPSQAASKTQEIVAQTMKETNNGSDGNFMSQLKANHNSVKNDFKQQKSDPTQMSDIQNKTISEVTTPTKKLIDTNNDNPPQN